LAALAELPGRLHHAADIVELGRLDAEDAVRVLAVVAFEEGLVIERIDLRRAAVHVQENDVADFRGMVEFAEAGALAERSTGARIVGEHDGQGDGAEAAAAAHEHFTTGKNGRHGEILGSTFVGH